MNTGRVVQILTKAKAGGVNVNISLIGGDSFNDLAIEEITTRGEVVGKRMSSNPQSYFYCDASEIACISSESDTGLH